MLYPLRDSFINPTMIARHKGEVPFLVYVLPSIAGIILSVAKGLGVSFLFAAIFCIVFLGFVMLNVFYAKLKVYKFNWLGGALLHLLFFLGGMLMVQLRDTRNAADYFGKRHSEHLVVMVNTEPTLKGKYWHFSADVKASKTQGKTATASGQLILTVLADTANLFKYGDELLIPANYKPVYAPYNPAAFNYKNYLANRHIYYQSFLFPGQYKIVRRNTGNPVIAYSLQLRQHFAKQFMANIKDTDAAAVATTLVLGYKATLSAEVQKVYSKTGTIHVLSVSGAHVAFVYVFINFVLGFLGVSARARWVKSMLSILLIWAYAMLTGFSPPVCRAAIMLSCIIIGRSGFRNVNQINLLAFSAFLLLVYDPLLITDIGFQLSYLAVFGLIVLQPVIFNWFSFENKWTRKFWYLISASLAAQVITFPLSAFYFHQFPLYFLLSNLLIIIPSELALFCGILVMLFGNIRFIGNLIYKGLEYTIIIMNKGLTLIEQQRFSTIDRIWFTGAECALLFIALMAFFYFAFNKCKAILLFSLNCLLLLCVSFTVKTISAENTNSITFLTISKHPAILFKHGHDGVTISDIKPADQLFTYNIKPAADSSGISDLAIHSLTDDYRNNWFLKEGHLIQSLNSTVLLFDKEIENFIPPKKINVSYLYVTSNPQTSVGFLATSYKFDLLIIDSTNSAATLKRLADEASHLKIKFVVLKRNKSLIVVSK
ncbi:ComEC/Rec2 family competence protein [Mucilaginibacter ginkgonis]|uniref:ComEC family competence protein n=1 Tax=Mucilaginibacter ginkgonis TaxID=2682091 RepID=A0A7T7FDD3_9SPHI|nr:ComEC/Rec2 family competence protein [Mucilaginibacter ginkgonis]QQL51292.1 ComEC family competence protein [Mucilaginibacter ginkgonis]